MKILNFSETFIFSWKSSSRNSNYFSSDPNDILMSRERIFPEKKKPKKEEKRPFPTLLLLPVLRAF